MIQWICFFLCLVIFLVFRFHALTQTNTVVVGKKDKPFLPPPIVVTQSHPWLELQPSVKGAALEIVRDFEKIHALSTHIPGMTEEELTSILIQKLLPLQKAIPFCFPETLYNVLCISDHIEDAPFPYRVFKRLYLGETELGLPFYLDVRVFDLHNSNPDEIIAWHLDTLDGERETLSQEKNRTRFICHGKRNTNRPDTTHGFAALQNDRALFLDFYQTEDMLYVSYAEAPLSTFKDYESLLRTLN